MRTDRRLLVSFASFVVALFSTIAFGEDLAVDCQFPGGNIIVEKIVGNRVELHQDPRDTAGFWFYWNFRVRGAAGRTLTFHFTQGDVIGTRGRAVSTDGGANWTWLGLDTVEKNKNNTFAYTFPADAREVRFCFAVPYQESNLRALLDRFAGNPCLKAEPHTKSRKGRTVERLRLGKLDGTPDHRVLLTCRHHSCEMMASWVLEGLLEKVLADTPDGRWLREHVEFLAIPFMDKDGVEEGDQGKNRKPHDHNRDYMGESLYPEVAALRQFVPTWSQGRLHIAIDLHCPWIRGGDDQPGSNERIVLLEGPSAELAANLRTFGEILEKAQTGPLAYHTRHNLRFGQSWNTLSEPKSSSRWTALQPGIWLATSLETPYANVAGQAVTSESARALGHDLTRAIRQFLEPNLSLRGSLEKRRETEAQ